MAFEGKHDHVDAMSLVLMVDDPDNPRPELAAAVTTRLAQTAYVEAGV